MIGSRIQTSRSDLLFILYDFRGWMVSFWTYVRVIRVMRVIRVISDEGD